MRRHLLLSALGFVVVSGLAGLASAKNPIQVENDKPVERARDNWMPELDATYQAKNIGINGIIDGYPDRWSYKHGDVLALKVSTVSPRFRTRVYRIGWYGNSPEGPIGSRLVHEVPETAGQRQPFPPEDATTGLAEPAWTDSLRVTIPGDWTPGHYAVRFTTAEGKEGYTHFVLRDDAAPMRAPILYVDSLLTENAYDPWPKIFDATGKQLSGKSTYSYNSAGVDVKASGAKQAVEVSLSRPRGENWGLSIWRDWTVPTVQFLEQHGYDVAYATSLDLHEGKVLAGRKMWMDSGHDEYWTAEMWDRLEAARDAGLNLAWFSGNDLTWQVRIEQGRAGRPDKMVAYKIAAYPDTGRCGSCWEWGGDPEFGRALAAKKAGDTVAQLAHLRRVTYAWSGLKDWDPDAPSPVFAEGNKGAPIKTTPSVARFAIGLEGLMNGPKLPPCPATADARHFCRGLPWVIEGADHWVFTGAGVRDGRATGLANNDRIPGFVGYEMDNARLDREYPMRPRTQKILGFTDAVFTPESGSAVDYLGLFNAQYYQHDKGAHVFAAGTINWFWGVDREGLGNWGGIDVMATVKPGLTTGKAITSITINVLNKLQEGPGTPPTDPGDPGDADAGSAGLRPRATPINDSCGCTTPGVAGNGALAGLVAASIVAWWSRRRRR
ncbi:MAG: hypothetical protein HYV09_23035 [Deltaproteobacteria bacterium]|nr:hypothetical protein [Deltaproteobacteria bacterium]